jgi:hypothetical protein
MASFGLERIGDYGSFIFLNALARDPTSTTAATGTTATPGTNDRTITGTHGSGGDDGTAMMAALTKCDNSSWCNEIERYNATMTSESLGTPHATMSHPWGTR